MTFDIVEEELCFRAGALRLEGVLTYPQDAPPRESLLLLAPHPHLGGRMDNNVVRHLARRGAEAGRVTLRFNYRGVGSSEIVLPAGTSTYDHFAALEREQRYGDLLCDARSAYDTLAAVTGPLPRRVVVGYSLGAVLAGMLGACADATHLVGISPPVPRVSLEPWCDCEQPKLFIGGDADFAFEIGPFEQQYATLGEPKRFERIPGADHFFRKQEERLHQLLTAWLDAGEEAGVAAASRGLSAPGLREAPRGSPGTPPRSR